MILEDVGDVHHRDAMAGSSAEAVTGAKTEVVKMANAMAFSPLNRTSALLAYDVCATNSIGGDCVNPSRSRKD